MDYSLIWVPHYFHINFLIHQMQIETFNISDIRKHSFFRHEKLSNWLIALKKLLSDSNLQDISQNRIILISFKNYSYKNNLFEFQNQIQNIEFDKT